MATQRAFRTPESFRYERKTRDMVAPYLESKGFNSIRDERVSHGGAQSQTIHALMPDETPTVMRVRLCWRRNRHKRRDRAYSAAQLMARIDNDDWEGSIAAKADRQREQGVTHLLLIQRQGRTIILAALIPVGAVLPIWCAQRDTSAAAIRAGETGNRKKNHAMNGSSPTLWLLDEKAPAVAAKLWNFPGVTDVGRMATRQPTTDIPIDDTFDDLPGLDLSLLGRDEGERYLTQRSAVKRDRKVRAEVLRLAQGRCERKGCGDSRSYSGFLDVHHILGAEKSDRVHNCVALCPNCHREAHVAPDRDEINAALLRIAEQRSVARQ